MAGQCQYNHWGERGVVAGQGQYNHWVYNRQVDQPLVSRVGVTRDAVALGAGPQVLMRSLLASPDASRSLFVIPASDASELSTSSAAHFSCGVTRDAVALGGGPQVLMRSLLCRSDALSC